MKLRFTYPFPLGEHERITAEALARMVGQTIDGHNAVHTVVRAWFDENSVAMLEIETETTGDDNEFQVFDGIPRSLILGSVGLDD